MAVWLAPGTAALALGLLAAPLAGAQPPTPVGIEFQVNTYTTDGQLYPSVALDADGDFVVVWESIGSSGTDTSSYSVHGQRYASDGSTRGAQFQVNTYTTGRQKLPSAAAEANGDFVVVWDSEGSSAGDLSLESIQGQRYASDGSTLGAQFQVNTYTTGGQVNPSVAADADGDLVVVWTTNSALGDSSGLSVQGQRYGSNGSTLGAQFQVNTYTTLTQHTPSITADADGDFVVAWESLGSSGTDSAGLSIQGQRFASSGSAQGAEFQVNTYTTNGQRFPSVAAAADGDFVVVWESNGSSGADTEQNSVQGQRYASNGSALGAQFEINTYTTGEQQEASVAAAADGRFVVVWYSTEISGTDLAGVSIQGQRYASSGSTLGTQFQVNTYTTNGQYAPAVAAEAGGDFVVAWVSDGSSGTDTTGFSIQGQRYRVVPAAVPALSRPMGLALAAAIMLLGACVLGRRA